MKKLLALILALCCISALFCFSVSAAGEKEVLLVVENDSGSIKVDISTEFACGAVQGAIKYDGDQIAYQSSTVAAGINSINEPANSISNTSGTTKVGFVCASNGGFSGQLASIEYSADESVPAIFDFTALKAFDKDGAKLTDVKVSVALLGDADNDGFVTVKDLVYFKQILLGEKTVAAGKERNLDVNRNGTNAQDNDITQLRMNLLK
ncbi:MAG: hypothetical protein IKZ47_07455 [Clostridia bacterium]|nr:hypothetical protein [Clostridia bacterium]